MRILYPIMVFSGLGSLAALVIYGMILTVLTATAENECLQYGYRDAKVTPNFQQYCVMRLDQTDKVYPIERVRNAVGEYTWPDEE